MGDQRFQEINRAAWIGIFFNILLTIVKGIVGFWANSRALIAEAAHSAADLVGSLTVYFGIRVAKRPPDPEHPYGHGKAEIVASFIVAVLLSMVGVEIARGSFQALFDKLEPPGISAAVVAFLSILVKEILYRYTYRVGKRQNSQATVAHAYEHRADVFATIAALVGILGAVLSRYIGVPELVYLDPIAGMGVSFFVFWMAYRLAREAIYNLLDPVLLPKEAQELVDAARQVAGVLDIDNLRARQHGHYVIVDVKISVDPHITVEEGHRIGKQVKRTLLDRFDHVEDVFVHVNPYDGKILQGK
ncbi:cation diffusion facilitator family transporter [Thermoactinomyces sp. DSM 45892]|uniref:cation diffusion facilitator family transporter n=1 Tax=Thermoactinomyces sp. DSM 45892 TaxID=1882753 RepID=UPI0008997EEA|nr:cation diffusion facilitator family transporter [Thermoactinomyces sp. DSM 45892]SDY03248.1 cation diffusion facilitator family transporter [Thermoactinomyces sp. DSM 45892]